MSEPDDFPKLTLEEVMECGQQAEENVAALRLRVEELTHERDQARDSLKATLDRQNPLLESLDKARRELGESQKEAAHYLREWLTTSAELGEARQARWIPVEERLPKEDEIVLFLTWIETDDHDGITQRWREVFRGTIYSTPLQIIATADDLCEYESGEVTHWMPLPEPPK